MCGKLLGDGCITKQNRSKPRFQFIHRIEDFGWSDYCYNQLISNIPLSPPKYGKVKDHRLKKGFSEGFVVQSRTDELISELYTIWYPASKKVLPFDFIEKYFDERTLAWWYQDDGHLKIVNGIATKLILSTDSFTLIENDQLINLIYNRFNILFSIDVQNRIILYDRFQIIYFLHLVSPWLHESMKRKWLPSHPIQQIANRTTIYLPSKYQIVKPTAEINGMLKNLNSLLDPSTQKICPKNIHNTFQDRLNKKKDVKSYQIVIEEHHRHLLAGIRQQTGLTISQLTDYCFRT